MEVVPADQPGPAGGDDPHYAIRGSADYPRPRTIFHTHSLKSSSLSTFIAHSQKRGVITSAAAMFRNAGLDRKRRKFT